MEIYIAIILAGVFIGFTAGITNEPAAGHITSGIIGLAAGILIAIYSNSTLNFRGIANVSSLILIYLLVLYAFYITGNIFRRNNKLLGIWGKALPHDDYLKNKLDPVLYKKLAAAAKNENKEIIKYLNSLIEDGIK